MQTLNIGEKFSSSWGQIILASTEISLCKELTFLCVKDVNLKESFNHASRLELCLIVTQSHFHVSKDINVGMTMLQHSL